MKTKAATALKVGYDCGRRRDRWLSWYMSAFWGGGWRKNGTKLGWDEGNWDKGKGVKGGMFGKQIKGFVRS